MSLRRIIPYMTGKKGGAYEPEYQAILDRASFLGYTTPDSTTNNRNNTRVKNLKDTGIWDKLDLLYMFDQPTGLADFAKINYISPSNFEVFNSIPADEPSFVADSGFKGNGSDQYFNTNFNMSSDKVNMTDTSAAYFYKGFDFISDSDIEAIYGARIGSTLKQVVAQSNNATSALFRTQSTQGVFGFDKTDHNLSILASSTTSNGRLYKDGLAFNSINAMSGNGFDDVELLIFCFNNATTAGEVVPVSFMKSGLKYFGISSDLGTGSFNQTAIDLHEIMTDIYTP